MRIGPLPDAMKLDIHGVGTHWNREYTGTEHNGRVRAGPEAVRG